MRGGTGERLGGALSRSEGSPRYHSLWAYPASAILLGAAFGAAVALAGAVVGLFERFLGARVGRP